MDSFINDLLEHFHLPLSNPVLIFSLILFIILLAPLLFERLRIPGIIGLILSGIIIGPSGFNVLEQSLFVQVFSTIGLLYIMFIAGLELDLHEFKVNRNRSLLFGFFTFVIPICIGFPVCHYLLEFDFLSSLLISSIFATHTLVTYPIVSKLGAAKDPSVAVTVGGTILTDTAVLIMLAIILGAHNGGLTLHFWMQLGVAIVVFSTIMFLLLPKIAGWFFQKLESEAYSHYIFVLAMVFLAAFLAELAGLEAIIGAFVAGLALNRLIPSSSALMSRIEFIGNALFIPFFLISVGMIVDINVILDGPGALIIAAVLTLVAVSGKFLAALATQLSFRLSKDQRNLVFGLSTAHAAATLAVVLVGYQKGLINDVVLNAIVIIILVSCIIASFVTEKAAKHIVENANESKDPRLLSELDMEQILVPLSSDAQVDKLLNLAVLIKDASSSHPLALLNVVANTDEAEVKVAQAKKKMESLLSETTAAGTEVKVKATIDHNTANGIARTAREIAADLIIMGWPQKERFFDKLLADPMDSILDHTIKTLFICNLSASLVNHKSIFLIVPPYAEFETGFPIWLKKITKLATELSLPIQLNCSDRTFAAITRFCELNKLTPPFNFTSYHSWGDMPTLLRRASPSDLMVLVSARRGHISHNNYMDRWPAKLERLLDERNRIVIYPQ